MSARMTLLFLAALGLATPTLSGFDLQASAQESVIAVPVTPGIQTNLTGKQGLAPFEIVTSPGYDYLVKLVDFTSSRDVMTIYVTGGVPLEVLVPLGSYGMKYASGVVWQGGAALFGPETSYSKTDDVFTFIEDSQGYSGYTVELILQTDGNLTTEAINADEF